MINESAAVDFATVRSDFPLLAAGPDGRRLTYLDSAATSQKPEAVIASMDRYYRTYNANPHRGVYRISEEATIAYEEVRSKVAKFINAKSTREIIFTRNTTEAINLVAYTWGRQNVQQGDEILLTEMEHHSNLVPWQILAKEKGAKLEFIPVDNRGMLDMRDINNRLNHRTRLVALTHASNVLGTVNPVEEITELAHRVGATVLVDGAQSVPHRPVDVRAIGCDFMAFSGHKMLGPMGIGVLYGRKKLLEEMPPFLGGGDMIREVHLRETTWNDLPWKFEAGTPAVAEAIGLGVAVDYLSAVGMDNVRSHEYDLTAYALEQLGKLDGITIYGPAAELRGGVISFTLADIHPHDLGSILDRDGVCIRAGHHCAQPLMERYGVAAMARASFYIYNTTGEIDVLVEALHKAQKIFRV